jgi:hypothetical protein
MKTGIAAALILLCSLARAETVTANTNYFPGYVLVTNTFDDAGNTGLSTGTAYCCFVTTNFSAMTEAKAGPGDSATAMIYGFVKAAYDAIRAQPSTNRPSAVTLSQQVTASSSADLKYVYEVEANINITASDVETE